MEIRSKAGYPASALSNFAPHPFIFRGVECASMEGLLQSFKFDKPHIQVEVCKLVGIAAKRRGQARNKAWQRKQTLWFDGIAYARHGKEYQAILDEAFDALLENEGFRKALLATGKAKLIHSLGSTDPSKTVLTRREFCPRLEIRRTRLWLSAAK